jgi:ABC-type multidrug transport system fused ATPase/permease subunit
MLASYSFGFWYGSKCILNTNDCPYEVSKQNYTAGNVLVVFFSVVMAGFNLSQLTPAFRKISEGRQAAARIF